jgi:mono/diheme cytochrome c family protein
MLHAYARRRAYLVLLVLAGLAAATGLRAQSAPPSYTAEQAARGQASYEHSCQTCHGSTLDNGDFGGPPLRGSWFQSHWGSGDAGALFGYVKAAMPPDNPGGLNDTVYADILAFVLRGNGYPPGAKELPSDAAALQGVTLKR